MVLHDWMLKRENLTNVYHVKNCQSVLTMFFQSVFHSLPLNLCIYSSHTITFSHASCDS